MVWPSWYDGIRNEKTGAMFQAPAFIGFSVVLFRDSFTFFDDLVNILALVRLAFQDFRSLMRNPYHYANLVGRHRPPPPSLLP